MDTRLKQILMGIGVGVLILGLPLFVSAEPPAHDHEKRGESRAELFEKTIQELNLTPRQQEQIAAQKKKEKQDSGESRARIKELRDQLRVELDKPSVDKDKIHLLTSEMKVLEGKRIERKVEGILTLKEIMTPEQFKALNEKRHLEEYQKRR
ncbi:MAG: periplasmic heavy metal sensor [Candidatus Omnitrophota bacterium]